MRLTICLTAAAIVCASSTPLLAKSKHAAFQLNQTSWTYIGKDGKRVRESIDANGNYIDQSVGGKHLDHGTAVIKDGKVCFTSAMTKEGETCFTTATSGPVKIGHSFVATSTKGRKVRVTRTKYVKLSMPS
jgi:hypothetical protein